MDVMLGFVKEETLRRVCGKVANLTALTRLVSAGGDQGINKAAEDFYCGLLNIILDTQKHYPGIKLVNMNAIQSNFPAIDLGDREKGVAVQVTTTEHREKINHTLEKFFEKELQKDFHKLIILIIGKKDETKKSFKVEDGFSFSPSQDIWDIDRLGAVLGDLSEEKLEEVERYFDVKVRYLRSSSPAINLPMISAMTAGGFVGREQELAQIAAEMANGTKPIFISGLGGMGKTELAVRFGRNYTGGNVYMVSFLESFRRTLTQNVAAGIPTLQGQKLSEQEIYDRVMHQLKQLDRADILIIDNADMEQDVFASLRNQDAAYKDLLDLPMHLIITTRCTPDMPVEVVAMPHNEEEKPLYQIFRNHRVNLAPEKMDALICCVQGHTMTVDLIARTLKNNRSLRPEQLIQRLQDGTISEQDYRAVGTTYASGEQRKIDAHLLALFRVADVPPETKRMLSCAVLIPQGGMDYDTFQNALPEDTVDALDEQIDHGWLQYDYDKSILTIHPVIKLVCRMALENWKEVCPDFLTRLHEQQDAKEFKLDVYRQLAEVYIAAAEAEISTDRAMWHYLAAWYLWKQGQYKEALDYEKETLRFREETLEENDPDLAHVYNDISVLYSRMGDFANALNYGEKALDIRMNLPEMDPKDLAMSYDNLGTDHGNLGDHKKALEYHNKALEIRERACPSDPLDLALSYNNIGISHNNLGNCGEALEFQLKALEIHRQILPENHPDLARSYNDAGYAYGELQEHGMALKHYMKAMEIREKILPENHPDTAYSYNNVGGAYYECGNQEKSLEYVEKALKIREKVLPSDHPQLGESYNNLGMAYGNLIGQEMSMKYVLKGLEIRKRTLPGNHPAVADSYANLAMTYMSMKDYRNAYNNIHEAVRVAKRCPSGKHVRLETYKNMEKHIKSILR